MNKYYSFRIPSPCHEDWNLMTPTEKGRYCNACAKTVIDFTVMSRNEISNFLEDNKGKKLCGHVRKSQLDSIHIKIPTSYFDKIKQSQRYFILALLVVMGTSLLSCEDQQGKKHKIDRIEVVDTLMIDVKDVPLMGKIKNKVCSSSIDSIQTLTNTEDNTQPQPIVEDVVLDGEIVVGMIVEATSTDEPVHISLVHEPPEFPDTPKKLDKIEKRHHFENELSQHFKSHINHDINTGLKGNIRAYTRFTINKFGQIEDVQVRVPHPLLEEEVRRIISLFPEFIPAKINGESVSVLLVLPVLFINEKRSG